MREIALRRLTELRAEADGLQYSSVASGDFKRWELSVETSLKNLFDESSTYLTTFRNLWFTPAVVYPDTQEGEWERAFLEGLTQAKGVLDSAIDAAHTYTTGEEKPMKPTLPKSENVDFSSLTIGALLELLTPGQAWGLAASVILLIFGSFTLGVKLAEYRVDRAQVRIERLEDEVRSLQAAAATDSTRRAEPLPASKSSPVSPVNKGTAEASTTRSSSNPTVKKQASAPTEDTFARARQATLSIGNEFYISGFLVDDKGTILTVDTATVLPKALVERGLPLYARAADGAISTTEVLLREPEAKLSALKMDRSPVLSHLRGFALAVTPPRRGDNVWLMSTQPNAPFTPVPAVVDEYDGNELNLHLKSGDFRSAGVWMGAPVINDQNHLVGMAGATSIGEKNKCRCVGLEAIRPIIEKAIKLSTQHSPGA